MHSKLVLSAALLLSAAPAVSAQSIVNGELTGPIAAGAVPPGWFLWNKTPDTVDSSGPFNNTPNPWAVSPDGGSFVRAGGSDLANAEAFAQNVTGFTSGTSYTLDMFVTNLGFEHPTLGDWLGEDGYWEVYIDGVLAGATSAYTKPIANTDSIVWAPESVGFVAPSASFEIALVARSSAGLLAAYMGIDGISVREVPAPGATGALLAGGLVAWSRRRRSSPSHA